MPISWNWYEMVIRSPVTQYCT